MKKEFAVRRCGILTIRDFFLLILEKITKHHFLSILPGVDG